MALTAGTRLNYYYIASSNQLVAALITVGSDGQTLEVGAPSGEGGTGPNAREYDVAPDGRVLMNVVVEEGTPPPMAVVLNWDAALTKSIARAR